MCQRKAYMLVRPEQAEQNTIYMASYEFADRKPAVSVDPADAFQATCGSNQKHTVILTFFKQTMFHMFPDARLIKHMKDSM